MDHGDELRLTLATGRPTRACESGIEAQNPIRATRFFQSIHVIAVNPAKSPNIKLTGQPVHRLVVSANHRGSSIWRRHRVRRSHSRFDPEE